MAILIFFSACNKSGSEKATRNGVENGDSSTFESDATATNSGQKLLSVYNAGNGYVYTFEYDGQKRITQITRTDTDDGPMIIKTITYSGADPISYTETGDGYLGTVPFSRNGNKVSKYPGEEYETILVLNSDGFIIRETEGEYESSYEYANGNMINYSGPASMVTYEYDDQKSVFHCNTPKWILYIVGQGWFNEAIWKNNVIKQQWSSLSEESFDTDMGSGTNEISYEYNKDGYPVKAHWEMVGVESWTATFEYK